MTTLDDTLDFLSLQAARHKADVASGDVKHPLGDRLKSRALELSSLLGTVARGQARVPEIADEALSVALGAANLLRIDLSRVVPGMDSVPCSFGQLAATAGRLADAAEKIDHLEPMHDIAVSATIDAARWAASVKAQATVGA